MSRKYLGTVVFLCIISGGSLTINIKLDVNRTASRQTSNYSDIHVLIGGSDFKNR